MSRKNPSQLTVAAAFSTTQLLTTWDPAGPGPLKSMTGAVLNTFIATTFLSLSGASAMTGALKFVAGAVATPGLAVSGDVSTGIWAPGAGILAISANGVERARFNAVGLVLPAGTVTTAPIQLTAGTSLTAPLAGVLEWDGTNLFVTQTAGPTRQTLAYVGTTAADTSIDGMFFGDGSDGNVTVSGAVTLTRDMYYNNLTIAAGAALNVKGFNVYVLGTLDLTAAPAAGIQSNGGAGGAGAAGGGAGTAGVANTFNSLILGGQDGKIGGAGGAAAGSPATTGVNTTNCVSIATQAMFAGGVGGPGSGGAGGTAGAGGTIVNGLGGAFRRLLNHLWTMAIGTTGSQALPFGVSAGAGSGGGGGGDGTAGGGGGGSGAGGGAVAIFARTITRGGSTAAGAIQVLGGAGGIGGTPAAGNRGSGGGGGGGPGGLVYIVYRFLTGSAAANAIDVTGGQGAAAGTATGTGIGGDGGGAGPSGMVIIGNLVTGLVSVSAQAAGIAGNIHPGGTAGGALKAATVARVAL